MKKQPLLIAKVIRTQDIFTAIAQKQLAPGQVFLQVGTLWATLALTDEQWTAYTFPTYPL